MKRFMNFILLGYRVHTVTSRDVNFRHPDLVMQTDFVGFKNQVGKTHPKWFNFVLHPLFKTKQKIITNPVFSKSSHFHFRIS